MDLVSISVAYEHMFPDRSDGTGRLTRSLVSGADGRRPSIPRPSLRPRPGRDRRRHRPALRRHRRRRPHRAGRALREQRRRARPARSPTADKYEHAAELLCRWRDEGVLVQDAEPTIWAYEQDYTAPDGGRRTRRGFLARIAVTDYGPGLVRPHERTQPGPKEDRLRLTRATGYNLSPIFVLHSGDAWSVLAPALPAEPFCEVTDPDGTVHRAWPIADPEVHDAVAAVVAGSELLIADGHHRYETARTYADEVGAGAGEDARYTLACLVSLEDPGLSVFATHRLLHDLDEAKRLALRDTLTELFDLEPIDDPADLVPDASDGTIAFGYMDSFHRKPYRLRLKDDAVLAAALPDASEAYRTLDAAALEALILNGPLAMSTDDIAAKRGLSYCSDFGEAVARLDAARPTRHSSSARRRSSRSAPSPTPARRCRRSRPTSSRSSSPGSPSTRSPAREGRMKIYTRKGDDGTTGLWYGGRRPKSDARIDAYGTIDEAGSALGVARSLCRAGKEPRSPPTCSASSATCSSPAPSSPPRPRPPTGSRTASAASPPRWSPSSSPRSTATWTGSSCRRSS